MRLRAPFTTTKVPVGLLGAVVLPVVLVSISACARLPFIGGSNEKPAATDTAADAPSADPASGPAEGAIARSDGQGKGKHARNILLEVEAEPAQIDLSRVRRIDVTVRLVNEGKRQVNLLFSSGQRIDMEVRDTAGTAISRWSEDQMFTQAIGNVLINPGERVEYKETMTTRGMNPGQSYTLRVFVPDYPSLEALVSLSANQPGANQP